MSRYKFGISCLSLFMPHYTHAKLSVFLATKCCLLLCVCHISLVKTCFQFFVDVVDLCVLMFFTDAMSPIKCILPNKGE